MFAPHNLTLLYLRTKSERHSMQILGPTLPPLRLSLQHFAVYSVLRTDRDLHSCVVIMVGFRYAVIFCSLFLFMLSTYPCTAKKGYTAAVYEHVTYFLPFQQKFTRNEALEVMKKNLAVYVTKAGEAKSRGAEIIVFPEDGLYGFSYTREEIFPFLEVIPNPSKLQTSWNPCRDPNRFRNVEVLIELSCIARNSSIVVIANMGDVQYCDKSDPHCPKDGRYQFNTDVVLESDGTLIAKYHKQNLFHEDQFNTPQKVEIVIFNTSFGVTFGVFTCFDMLFHDPAITLVEKYGVRNIVFPTAWFHGFPTLISVEFQQAWSRLTCVNLLAANQHQSLIGMGGSGIYSCGEALTYVYDMKTYEGHLLIATLPNFHNKPEQCLVQNCQPNSASFRHDLDFGLLPQLHGKTFPSKLMHDIYTFVKLEATEGNTSVCNNDLCCHVSYSTSNQKPFEDELFALGAFSGYHGSDKYYVQVCVLVKCKEMEETSCGTPITSASTVFKSFSVVGNFSSKAYVYPEVLSSGVKLISAKNISFSGPKMTVESFNRPLLSAALFGRIYELDNDVL